jgi:PKD repeat protein
LIHSKNQIMLSIKNIVAFSLLATIAFTMGSCKYDVKELGPKPVASFDITPINGRVNTYLLSSTSANSFRYDWDKDDGAGYVRGLATDTVYFPDKGTYTIKLLSYGQSGMDSSSKQITVANDDPAAVTPFKLLTGNSSRTWKLAPEPGALFIGPPDFSQTWWASGAGDVTSRSCLFNDEYTFRKDGSVLQYDSKGDFYVDEEGGAPHPAGMPAVGCYANSAIPAQFQAWANSGNFTFAVVGNKLTLFGTGAHLGLYKAGTTNPALNAPESSVTYDIVSITANRLVIKLDYGWGAWRFTYVAN